MQVQRGPHTFDGARFAILTRLLLLKSFFYKLPTQTSRKSRERSKKIKIKNSRATSLPSQKKNPERRRRRKMGSEGEFLKKPRILCLHGFRTSGEILKKQVEKWPESVIKKMDLFFPDGPFPAQGKSDVEGIFDPPYYEWFQFNKEFTEYTNFDECLQYIEDFMVKNGPFDGLLGFSQGAILSGALPGLQAKGVALTKVPKIKFLMIIGGAKFRNPEVADNAYASSVECPSLHFLGETDFLKPYGLELLKNCVDPLVINHPKGHTVPRLDEKSLPTMENFLEKIRMTLVDKEQQ